jgi:hypothetical protein
MYSRISDTREMALEAVDRARDRLGREKEQAGKKMTEVKTKVFGAFNSLFGGGKKPPTPQGQGQSGAGSTNMRGGIINAPVARAVPRQGPNM